MASVRDRGVEMQGRQDESTDVDLNTWEPAKRESHRAQPVPLLWSLQDDAQIRCDLL